jgi:undecaprenyl-diphosphatase
LLAGCARRRAAAAVACCAVLVAALGALFAHQAGADWLDRAVDAPVIAWLRGPEDLAARLAAPGSLVPAVALSASIVIGCLLAGRLNGAVLAALAVPAAAGLNDGLIKPLVHRTYLGVLSYPSGHTAAVGALAAAVTVLSLRPPLALRRALIPAAAWLLCGAVALGVIGLRWHYFTDTAAGAAVGIGTACGLALILDLPAARRCLTRACRGGRLSPPGTPSPPDGRAPARCTGRRCAWRLRRAGPRSRVR